MKQKQSNASLHYQVAVTRQDEVHVVARSRGHELTLNVKKGDGTAGFNAAETLLAALGACIVTNINSLSQKMHLDIRDARIEFLAERQDEPPILTRINYRLILNSPEPTEKLAELYRLAVKWGTVTSTLASGLTPEGQLIITNPATTTVSSE